MKKKKASMIGSKTHFETIGRHRMEHVSPLSPSQKACQLKRATREQLSGQGTWLSPRDPCLLPLSLSVVTMYNGDACVQGMEAGGLGVQGYHRLHSQVKASLGYVRLWTDRQIGRQRRGRAVCGLVQRLGVCSGCEN